jgi:hypothetical protein
LSPSLASWRDMMLSSRRLLGEWLRLNRRNWCEKRRRRYFAIGVEKSGFVVQINLRVPKWRLENVSVFGVLDLG